MLSRKAPLQSGTDTEIDLIEREMEGGVFVEQPLESEEEVEVDWEDPTASEVPKD